MLRIKFRYAFYGKTEHSFESGIMKIKVIQRDTEVQMKEIKLKAMAKINLGLDVTRKREDDDSGTYLSEERKIKRAA